MTETRIRWEPTEPGSDDSFGYAGTLDPAVFTIWAPRRDDEAWEVTSALPQLPGERHAVTDREEAVAEAEHWLEEFVSSLGAVFPEPAFEFDEDAEPIEVRFAAGRRVRYAHSDAGWPGEKEHAAEHLTLGEVYTIAWADIGQSRTDLNLYCCGVLAGRFNSVFFEPADDEAEVTT